MRHKLIYLAILAIYFAISGKVYADEIVHIPDSAFKKALINMGVDRNNDGEIQYIEASAYLGIKDEYGNEGILDVGQYAMADITNLTGIKAFTAVNTIHISSFLNKVNLLDLSGMDNISYVTVTGYGLKQLDISNCYKLKTLNYAGGQLEKLNIRNCIELSNLYCPDNNLTEIDMSFWDNQPINFETISCFGNKISKLLLTNVKAVYAHNNRIHTFDASNLNDLSNLKISNNKLQELNIQNGKNKNINAINTKNNPDLKCITVDNPKWAKENWKDIDEWTKFSEDCSISVLETENTNIKIYPNPAKNNLFIEFNCEVKTDIEIYDIQGALQSTQTVQTGYNFVNLDVSKLSKGNYFVKINNQIKKIIIE